MILALPCILLSWIIVNYVQHMTTEKTHRLINSAIKPSVSATCMCSGGFRVVLWVHWTPFAGLKIVLCFETLSLTLFLALLRCWLTKHSASSLLLLLIFSFLFRKVAVKIFPCALHAHISPLLSKFLDLPLMCISVKVFRLWNTCASRPTLRPIRELLPHRLYVSKRSNKGPRLKGCVVV